MIDIKKIVSYDMDQNCYLVCDENKTGILIDPGFDTDKIKKAIDDAGASVEYILLTHCHYDHCYSVNSLRGYKKLVCSEECSQNIISSDVNASAFTEKPFQVEKADIILADGEEFIVGNMTIKAIKTPGHTNGGMCYLIENALFSGDTLFYQSIGRWDLPTGSGRTLIKSIQKKLYTLPDDIVVYSGHGKDTTIGYEKKFNMCVTETGIR